MEKPNYLLTTPVNYDHRKKKFKIYPRHLLIPLPGKSGEPRSQLYHGNHGRSLSSGRPGISRTVSSSNEKKARLHANSAKMGKSTSSTHRSRNSSKSSHHKKSNSVPKLQPAPDDNFKCVQTNSVTSPSKPNDPNERLILCYSQTCRNKSKTADHKGNNTKTFGGTTKQSSLSTRERQSGLQTCKICHKRIRDTSSNSYAGHQGNKGKVWKKAKITRSYTPEIASSTQAKASIAGHRKKATNMITRGCCNKLQSFNTHHDPYLNNITKILQSNINHNSPADILGKTANLNKIYKPKPTNIEHQQIPVSQYGWRWHGKPFYGCVLTENSTKPRVRLCYPAIQHVKEGDIIRIKDDVVIRSFDKPRESSEITTSTLKSTKKQSSPASKLLKSSKTPNKVNKKTTTIKSTLDTEETASADLDLEDASCHYFGKIMGFWNHNGEMKMTILWYYQKEQVQILNLSALENTFNTLPYSSSFLNDRSSFTTTITQLKLDPNFEESKINAQFPFAKYGSPKELFASRHIDTLSVGCIEDKAFVFPYNQYCRLQAKLEFLTNPRLPSLKPLVPSLTKGKSIPPFKGYSLRELTEKCQNIYFCSRVYDPICKRIVKNPVF